MKLLLLKINALLINLSQFGVSFGAEPNCIAQATPGGRLLGGRFLTPVQLNRQVPHGEIFTFKCNHVDDVISYKLELPTCEPGNGTKLEPFRKTEENVQCLLGSIHYIGCPVSARVNGHVIVDETKRFRRPGSSQWRVVGADETLVCNPGFVANGNLTAKCLGPMTFSNALGSCEPILTTTTTTTTTRAPTTTVRKKCQASPIANGVLVKTLTSEIVNTSMEFSFNASLTLKCSKNYHPAEYNFSYCNSDGTWWAPLQCLACGDVAAQNSKLSAAKAAGNFHLVELITEICTAKEPTTIQCRVGTVENGKVVTADNVDVAVGSNLQVNSSVNLACDAGFRALSRETSFCLASGIWSSPLQCKACDGNDADIVKATINGDLPLIGLILVKCETGTEIRDENGWTPLLWAAEKNRSDIVQYLLENGANVNALNSANSTALILAAKSRNLTSVKLLVEGGADVNRQSNFGASALLLAASNGDVQMASFLLANGADSTAKDSSGVTVLMWSVQSGSNVTTAAILENFKGNINEKDNSGRTALMRASVRGSSSLVNLLLKSGADVTLMDNEGRTAFDIAMRNGHRELMPLLVADVPIERSVAAVVSSSVPPSRNRPPGRPDLRSLVTRPNRGNFADDKSNEATTTQIFTTIVTTVVEPSVVVDGGILIGANVEIYPTGETD